jgi:protein TonB
MSDSGMLVDTRSGLRNRHELRLVAASLAASFGIHAAALGLFPPVTTGINEPPAPINVNLRLAAHGSDVPPAAIAVSAPVAPPTPVDDPEPDIGIVERNVPAARPAHPAPRVESPKRRVVASPPRQTPGAVVAVRPVEADNAPNAAATLRSPAPSRPPQHAEAAIPPPPTPVAGTSPLAVDVAATIPPSFRADYLSNPPPTYPRRARRAGLEGTVRLKVRVTAAGAPDTVEIETSSGFETLDLAALNAVKGWQFVPARRGADRIDAWVIVPVVFRLESG